MSRMLIPLRVMLILVVLVLIVTSVNTSPVAIVEQSTLEPTAAPTVSILPEVTTFAVPPFPQIPGETSCAGNALYTSLPPKCFDLEGNLVPAWTDSYLIPITR